MWIRSIFCSNKIKMWGPSMTSWVYPYPLLRQSISLYLSWSIAFIEGMDQLKNRVWINSRHHWRSTLCDVFLIHFIPWNFCRFLQFFSVDQKQNFMVIISFFQDLYDLIKERNHRKMYLKMKVQPRSHCLPVMCALICFLNLI